MSIRTTVVSLAAVSLFAIASGCEIHDCQEGAVCTDDDHDDRPPSDTREMCIDYCVRLSVCGAPQADDFDDCVDSCKDRFERAPDRTRELCECAEWSSCSDVVDGRCSPKPNGTGGSTGSGGSSYAGSTSGGAQNIAGAPSAGTGATAATGGAQGMSGSPGSYAGSPSSGGTSSGGMGGCSAGAGTGAASSAGSPGAGMGGAGTGGEDSGEAGDASCSCS